MPPPTKKPRFRKRARRDTFGVTEASLKILRPGPSKKNPPRAGVVTPTDNG